MRRYFSKKLMRTLLKRLKQRINSTEKELQQAKNEFRDEKVDAKVQILNLRMQSHKKQYELMESHIADCYEKIDELIDIIAKKFDLRFVCNGTDMLKKKAFQNMLSKFDSNSWIHRTVNVDAEHVVYYKNWRSRVMIFFKCVYDVKPTGVRDVYFTFGWFPMMSDAVTIPIRQLALSEHVLGLFASNNPEGKRPYMGAYSKHLKKESDAQLIVNIQSSVFDLIQSDYDRFYLFQPMIYSNGVMSVGDYLQAMKEA